MNSINRLVAPTGEGDIIQKLVLDITEHVEIERALVKISYEDTLTHLFLDKKTRETHVPGLKRSGGPSRIRTCNPGIMSPLR